MPRRDFDLESLAKYLHLSPQQVQKLVDRGKVPGRRIGGEWRFSRDEIHHWLEDRIGAADDADLAQVEQVLRTSRALTDEDPLRIHELLLPEAIAIPLPARTRKSVIRSMVDLVAKTGLVWDIDRVLEAVEQREILHPTALDCGVALLHPRRPMTASVAQPLLAMGRTTQGLPFGAAGGQLTDIYFLIMSTDDAGHLNTLARLSRMLSADGFLDALREATSPGDVLAAMEQFDGLFESPSESSS
ncbi:putative PTS IIA-like nitrogen-regulatory protein PtsN [Pirellula staleyi DSM 6068]|uniref:Putative PTS IIA-like nitrogen-regulatory protein PtsN n=1 Tax=Pirellula staleyi (strain ATCC 27377 / DSM 6068 / ICPB 4128) TaxID=530564 RepID=D2R7R6_PIRSD|nr:PTS sugar transporter subunit IIA [Pirellula staleyi]ADB17492.1 putative PTS IIA-like nitrogen-regulatory protein PtsN [Pirellula staleyi DSM 6068]